MTSRASFSRSRSRSRSRLFLAGFREGKERPGAGAGAGKARTSPLEGKKIHRASEIPIFTFGRGFIDELAARLERRVRIALSVTERHLYLGIDGTSLTTVIEEHRLEAV